MNHKKILIENFLSLSSLQVINYILPLITVPYLVRIIGPEKFGLIAFATAFSQYFILLTDYGFNLSVTRRISIFRENTKRVSEIFSSVMFIKFSALIISLFFVVAIVFSFHKFRQFLPIHLLTFGMVIGNVLFPVWLFQGMENMKYITFLNILAKTIFIVSIFAFVRQQEDYLLVPLFNSLGCIIAGVLSLKVGLKKFGIKPIFPSKKAICEELKKGFPLFVSMTSISLYTISNTFILGLFTNNTIVGYYSAGEKIVKAITGLIQPMSRTIYPHVSKLVLESKDKALYFIRAKILKIYCIPTFILSIALLIFAPHISNIILGNQFAQSILIIQILSFLPFIIGLSNIFAVQLMLNFGMQSSFSKIVLIAAIINIFLALALVGPFQHVGVAIAMLVTEIYVTITTFIVLQSNGIKVFSFQTHTSEVQ